MVPDPCLGFCIWMHYYRVLCAAREAGLPGVMFLRYEDVVKNPRDALAEVLDFLSLRHCTEVAEGFGNTEGIPPRELIWKQRAMEPIGTHRIGLWQEELGRGDVEVMERIGGQALKDLGYSLQTNGRGSLTCGRLLTLAWNAARFALRIPLPIVLREALGRENYGLAGCSF